MIIGLLSVLGITVLGANVLQKQQKAAFKWLRKKRKNLKSKSKIVVTVDLKETREDVTTGRYHVTDDEDAVVKEGKQTPLFFVSLRCVHVINRRTNEDKRRNRSRSVSEEKRPEIPVKEDKPRKLDDVEAEEKYKKLLILRKKMELLELKKKKEEEQVNFHKSLNNITIE